MITWLVLGLVAATVSAAHAQSRSASPGSPASPPSPAAPRTGREVHNPSLLRATELLARAVPGVAPRVRFEWDRVRGSTEYVLAGRWASAPSWALRSGEYRVTARNASSWGGDRVAFDVSLPEGSHSWTLVAIFGPNDAGDFGNPAHVSFTLR